MADIEDKQRKELDLESALTSSVAELVRRTSSNDTGQPTRTISNFVKQSKIKSKQTFNNIENAHILYFKILSQYLDKFRTDRKDFFYLEQPLFFDQYSNDSFYDNITRKITEFFNPTNRISTLYLYAPFLIMGTTGHMTIVLFILHKTSTTKSIQPCLIDGHGINYERFDKVNFYCRTIKNKLIENPNMRNLQMKNTICNLISYQTFDETGYCTLLSYIFSARFFYKYGETVGIRVRENEMFFNNIIKKIIKLFSRSTKDEQIILYRRLFSRLNYHGIADSINDIFELTDKDTILELLLFNCLQKNKILDFLVVEDIILSILESKEEINMKNIDNLGQIFFDFFISNADSPQIIEKLSIIQSVGGKTIFKINYNE